MYTILLLLLHVLLVQVRSIMGQVRPDRQTLLFTATMPTKVDNLVRDCLTTPVRITVGEVGAANQDIQQASSVRLKQLVRTLCSTELWRTVDFCFLCNVWSGLGSTLFCVWPCACGRQQIDLTACSISFCRQAQLQQLLSENVPACTGQPCQQLL